ncbi:NUDIX domain-containing protein [Gallaecimonas sp. GXIMD4217]|uniref:NUDIX hydrolase n=1 Tax=Gallaecimonas sp. GXIMD4217 TaxID=3131927 RepID=UPI00311B368A
MPREAVVAVIVHQGKVLVIKRAKGLPGGGHWTPPAGRVEPGEAQAAALVREVWEELGLTVRPLRRIWQCMADGADYQLHWWLADYLCGTLHLAGDEVAEARWIRPESFAELNPSFPKGRFFFDKVLPRLPEWQLQGEADTSSNQR